ncbi:polysaccharide deacetylase family protein [Paenibacillus aceris]|uniref:Peptidoglycan/xylan/chitin deacetylase (PgdA/CDA1 family) n=1 Tax=Paenibacillus aceris TaxID=869555 RepID=A0ABS4I613_9BACL|nr:polysaccharide deacetylase family protein [Paenibacillus aceris]MBP1966349.1 peptidoglycan/xylan/chitin deacetylase (PgdA/CDA1 family) [Paenibacillus aceris]NHW38607.1 polysaccharide deacetylase family protein [Paenibacillus aceris]
MRERKLGFLFLLYAVITLTGCKGEMGPTQRAHEAAVSETPNSVVSAKPVAQGIVTPMPSAKVPPTVTPTDGTTVTPSVTSTVRSSATPSDAPKDAPTVTSPIQTPVPSSDTPIVPPTPGKLPSLAQSLVERYKTAVPTKWGENISGVRTRLVTKEKVIALTFDACGGKEGSGYDEKLVDYLIKEQIPATLFVNARWLAANPDIFAKLAANPLFEIENHGTEHRPLSVNGRAAYGIAGTKNVSEVIREVTENADEIEKLTGRRPLFFRSGTAYYDDVAADIAHDLGFQLAGYNVLGDAGATFNTEQVYNALTKAKSGSVVLAHMNHPEKDTAEGVIKAIPFLQKAGFRFVQLLTYPME